MRLIPPAGNIMALAEKIRAKLEFFKRALRGSTYTAYGRVSFSFLWILHLLFTLLDGTPKALADSGYRLES